jgi:hypothetical protein
MYRFLIFSLVASVALPLLAGVPFPASPDWESADVSSISTGGALVDLDRDGWLDLVVSNGNDISLQPLVVYYNRGDGTFPDSPDWYSLTAEFHGQLAAGDVNGDGWTDIAVSVFIGPAGFSEPGRVILYLNDGAGNLPDTPSWVSSGSYYTFCLALGDADSDGDLDLAVATGEPYTHRLILMGNLVFYNDRGSLDEVPGWTSDEGEHSLGVAWGDADNDGDLDIAFAGNFAPHRVYHQEAGSLETTSGWQSSTSGRLSIRLSMGDLDRDGYSDLAVTQNSQLGGVGGFKIYSGGPSGLSQAESWGSDYAGYCSEAVIGDANGDGWPDLLTGGWGNSGAGYADQVRIYPNRYVKPLERVPQWTSGTGSVHERILLGDVDNDGLRETREVFETDGTRKLFFVERIPFREITGIWADRIELGPDRYCHSPENGWISLVEAPAGELIVDYLYSTRLDMVVLNWDDDQGNFLFYSREPALLFAEKGPTGTELRFYWSGGLPPFDLLESADPAFGPGLELKAEGLALDEWTDLPGSLPDGDLLLFFKIY